MTYDYVRDTGGKDTYSNAPRLEIKKRCPDLIQFEGPGFDATVIRLPR